MGWTARKWRATFVPDPVLPPRRSTWLLRVFPSPPSPTVQAHDAPILLETPQKAKVERRINDSNNTIAIEVLEQKEAKGAKEVKEPKEDISCEVCIY